MRKSKSEQPRSLEGAKACVDADRMKRRPREMLGSIAFAVLLSAACSFQAWAANDPKDLASQNAQDASVIQSTGQTHFRIEIPMPKGTGGSEPDLALSYASNLSDGPFGVGWGVELGEIRRAARYGTPAYEDAEDAFEFDGVLLVAHPDQIDHPGEYRTVQESFARITHRGQSWEVDFPDGRTARFGTNQETRIRRGGDRNPEDDMGEIGRWLLSELEDAHGNITRFHYDRDSDVGTAYPDSISYTYREGSDTPVGGAGMVRRIQFVLENRTDEWGRKEVIFGYPLSIETRIGKRVREIQSFVGSEIYRRLVLTYAKSAEYTTGRSRLWTAQLFGTDCPVSMNPTDCEGLPPRTFTYTDSDAIGIGVGAQWANKNWPGEVSLHFTQGEDAAQGRDRGVRIGDINGDGYPDYVRLRGVEVLGYPNLVSRELEVYLNDGTGWGARDLNWEARIRELTFAAKGIKEIRTGGVTCSVEELQQSWAILFVLEHVFNNGTKIFPLVQANLMDLNGDGFADILLSFETGAGSATADTPCSGTPRSWAAVEHVKHVWINKAKADPTDVNAGWEQRDDWAESLPPFHSIYLRSDGGTGADRPGRPWTPGERRGTPTQGVDSGVTFAYFVDHGVRMPDLNGDGRPDIIAKRDPATFGSDSAVYTFEEGAWLSAPDGVGWVRDDNYIPPVNIVAEFNYYKAPDYSEASTLERRKYVADADAGVRFADLNGDGLADLIKTTVLALGGAGVHHGRLNDTLVQEGVWLNTGAGWCGANEGHAECDAAQKYLPPSAFTTIDRAYQPPSPKIWDGGNLPLVRSSELAFVDLNGDGLVDLLKTDSPQLTEMNAWIHDPSKRSIWAQDNRFVPDVDMATAGLWEQENGDRYIVDKGVRIFDYDGDATVDLLKDRGGSPRKMYISQTAHADLLERIENGQGGLQQFEYTSVINKDQRNDGLEAFAQADAVYSGEADFIGLPRWTARSIVSRMTTADTLAGGTTHTTTMTYAMPQWDPIKRSQLGFRAAQTTQDDGSTNLTYFWQAPGRAGRIRRALIFDGSNLRHQRTMSWEVIPGSEADGSISGVKIGRMIRDESASYYGRTPNEVAGATHVTTLTYVDADGGAYGYNFVHQAVVSRPTGDLIIQRFPEPTDTLNWIIGKLDREILKDANGDVLKRTEYDYDRGLPILIKRLVKPRYASAVEKYANTANAYDDYGNLIQSTDPEGRTTHFCHDGDSAFQGDGSACPDQLETDSHTVVVGVKDPRGDVTRFSGDPIDLASGALTTIHREYSGDRDWVVVDPFGRTIERWTKPSGQAADTILATRKYVDDPTGFDNLAGRPFVVARSYFKPRSGIDEAATVRTVDYLDGLGRKIAAASPVAPGSAFPFGRAVTARDHAGRPTRGTLDLACTDADCTNLATARFAGVDEITQTYDALGRVLTRTTPDGVAAFDYRQLDLALPAGLKAPNSVSLDVVLAKDPNGILTEKLLDGDRLVMANECANVVSNPSRTDLSAIECEDPDSTFYTYEASGELESIYDASPAQDYGSAAHRLTYRYDTLGRVWLVEDPDGGTKLTLYDLVGNVTQTTNLDNASNHVNYEYDELNRLKRINPPDEISDWDLTIDYDAATRKRSRVRSTGSYSESWEYDDFGNLKTNRREMFDRALRTDFEYDLLGRLTRLQSPLASASGKGVSYGYAGGYLVKVCSELQLSDCEARPSLYFVNDVAYDALGRARTISEPPGDVKLEYYTGSDAEPDKAVQRVKSMRLNDAEGSRLDLRYKYNAGGQIIHVADGHTGDDLNATAGYGYDQRGRLRYWTGRERGVDFSRYFAYDELGNLVGRDLPSATAAWNQFYETANKPHAISSSGHSGKSYAYDGAGNVTQRGDEHRTYNALGQVYCVGTAEGPCVGGAFRYDIDGNLLAKTVGGTSEIYLGNYFRFDKKANIAWTYTSAFGRRIVMQKETNAGLRAAWAPATWRLPIDRELFFQLLIAATLLGLLALLSRLGILDAIGERPVTVSLVLGVIVLVVAPPQAWAARRGKPSVTLTRYLFHDHLGSEVLALDERGTVVERRVFEPFGEVIASQTDLAAGALAAFTGKTYHEELSLYHFGARWYDSEAGRFVSIDPILQSVPDPQTHNPYGYVRNNPIGYVDPDGRAANINGGSPNVAILLSYAVSGLLGLVFGGSKKSSPPPAPQGAPVSGDTVIAGNAVGKGERAMRGFAESTAKRYGNGTQSGANPDPLDPNPGNFFKVEVFGVDVVTPLGGFEFSSGFFVGRDRAGNFQAGPFVEGGPAIGAGLSVDTLGGEFVSNIDQLDRSYSINGVLGAGIFNAQGNINPTPPNHGERFIGDFVNGAGVGLSFGPLPVEGFFSFTQTRSFDVIGFGRRVFGQ